MIEASEIGWGSYREFEGPLFWGKQRHQVRERGAPVVSDEADILSVLTATEGGTYDAYNGYDKCLCTSGLIQWCDRAPMFLVTKLLGTLASKSSSLVVPIFDCIFMRGYTFKPDRLGTWHFHQWDGSLVDSVEKQRQLYFGGASGLKGEWTEEQKAHARMWAAAVSSVWQNERARQLQLEYTNARLFSFALPAARRVLEQAKADGSPVAKAFIAAYLSFAGNNPSRADISLFKVTERLGVTFTDVWLVEVLHSLTFNPGVAIYPHRYNKIRPLLEALYGVDLPDISSELEPWLKKHSFKGELTTSALQRALLHLGYDLGPKKDDGVFGKKTKAALLDFETDAGVPEVFRDGVPDQYTIPYLEKALAARGLALEWST